MCSFARCRQRLCSTQHHAKRRKRHTGGMHWAWCTCLDVGTGDVNNYDVGAFAVGPAVHGLRWPRTQIAWMLGQLGLHTDARSYADATCDMIACCRTVTTPTKDLRWREKHALGWLG